MKKRQDWYFKRAKSEGFRSRAVYKLREMNKQFTLLKRGENILDLGAAPGSWSQYVVNIIGSSGKLISVDIKELHLPSCHVIQGDFTKPAIQEQIREHGPYDMLISDAAPSTSGDHMVDAARSLELCLMALKLGQSVLEPRGNFIAKILEGSDSNELFDRAASLFETVRRYKPKASRSESSELYIVAMNYRITQDETTTVHMH